MNDDANKLAEALAASTPGVWCLSDRDGPYVRVVDGIRWLGDAMTVEDGRFFVEAHNRLPSVLADADASQHWRTRALRAEQALEEARADAEGKAARLDVMETERNEARDRLADARADHLDAVDSARLAQAERDAAQDLVSRAITNAGRHAARPLWSHIMHLFAVGSTRAHALCADHGYDPDQEVGPSKRPQRKA